MPGPYFDVVSLDSRKDGKRCSPGCHFVSPGGKEVMHGTAVFIKELQDLNKKSYNTFVVYFIHSKVKLKPHEVPFTCKTGKQKLSKFELCVLSQFFFSVVATSAKLGRSRIKS